MTESAKLTIREGAGPNGEPLLVYSDALYEAFKAALLGQGGTVISNGESDARFVAGQARRMGHLKRDKLGPWVQNNDSNPDGYVTTLKFIPPLLASDLPILIEKFKKECGIDKLPNPGYRPPAAREAELMAMHQIDPFDPDQLRCAMQRIAEDKTPEFLPALRNYCSGETNQGAALSETGFYMENPAFEKIRGRIASCVAKKC